MKRLVILESPYAGDVVENINYARQCIRDCVLRNEAPIASHLLLTQPNVLDDSIAEERKLGIECGLAWAKRADAMVVYTDRGISAGMQAAIKYADGIELFVEFRKLKDEPAIT